MPSVLSESDGRSSAQILVAQQNPTQEEMREGEGSKKGYTPRQCSLPYTGSIPGLYGKTRGVYTRKGTIESVLSSTNFFFGRASKSQTNHNRASTEEGICFNFVPVKCPSAPFPSTTSTSEHKEKEAIICHKGPGEGGMEKHG